jgi:hypothetical protein
MTSTIFSNIYMGLRMTDSMIIKVFMIISGRFSMSFEILLTTFVRERRLQWSLLSSSRTVPLVEAALYLCLNLVEHLSIPQSLPL